MTHASHPLVALAAAIDLPVGAAPDWVQLLPAEAVIATFDGRGPYRVEDMAAVAAESRQHLGRMLIDECHATDKPGSTSAPARGWITEVEARPDGLWGRVDWNAEGRQLVETHAYRSISPVLGIDPRDKKTIRSVMRASLVNTPNLRGLASLNQENSMSFMAKLAEKLGLKADASEDDILAALPGADTALQSALTEIGTVLGVTGGDTAAIVAAARAKAAAQPAEIVALQSQLAAVTTEVNTLRDGSRREKAVAFVDGAIVKGHVGVKPSRDRFISMHMADPANAEAVITGMPILGPSGLTASPPAADGVLTSLNATQIQAADLLGLPHDIYLAALKAEHAQKEKR